MALNSTAAVLIASAIAAGASTYNTNRTLSRQDDEAARGILNQSRIQRETDQRVNEQVDELEGSRSADERAKRLADYMGAVQRVRRKTNAGLDDTGAYGEAFTEAATAAKGRLAAQGAQRADLMAGIDAPGLQRQGEAFDFGRLATDIGLLGRESAGADWLTRLRMQGIRRSPGIDALASFASGVASGAAQGGGGAAANTGGYTNADWLAAMRYGMGGG